MPKYPMCRKHNRRSYPDEGSATHACLASSRSFHKPFRMYECKVNGHKTGCWHITTKGINGVNDADNDKELPPRSSQAAC